MSLEKWQEQGKVVFLFCRGQGCPVGSRYLSGFQDSVQYILNKGASVVAITPETSENAEKIIAKTGMSFTVIPDQNGEIMKAYDVLFSVTEKYQKKINMALKSDIAENNGAKEALLPVPATYIIDKNGTIEKVFFDHNYKKRASVKEILEVL